MTIILITLLLTHITIMCVTLYLHRSQTHLAVEFHPAINHFMRFWLWLTTGMITKQWVAIHRKHHRFSDAEGDPHSPIVLGIKNVFFRGVYYYYKEAKNAETVVTYGKGTPNDWVERKIYSKYHYLGIVILLFLELIIFGPLGLLVWLCQIVWIPFWAASVINGIGHKLGYRNHETRDNSKNIVPWAVWIGGEELHNNHHVDPASAKFSYKWWEFDIGWFYINILRSLGLAKTKTR